MNTLYYRFRVFAFSSLFLVSLFYCRLIFTLSLFSRVTPYGEGSERGKPLPFTFDLEAFYWRSTSSLQENFCQGHGTPYFGTLT